MATPQHAPRSVLVVQGSGLEWLDGARTAGSDAVCLDLTGAVAPADKAAARGFVVDALVGGGWGTCNRTVRVHALTSRFTYRDVIEVVEGAGAHLDALVLPDVAGPHHVQWLDLLLTQIEQTMRLDVGRIGIEAQVASAAGLLHAAQVATASPRVQSLVVDTDALAADLGLTGTRALDAALLTVRTAATAAGVQAVDGSWSRVLDLEAFQARATRSAARGLDGTWVLDPAHVAVVHEVFRRGGGSHAAQVATGQ